jgi:hypothetical protein
MPSTEHKMLVLKNKENVARWVCECFLREMGFESDPGESIRRRGDLGLLVHTYNPSTQEAEVGGCLV